MSFPLTAICRNEPDFNEDDLARAIKHAERLCAVSERKQILEAGGESRKSRRLPSSSDVPSQRIPHTRRLLEIIDEETDFFTAWRPEVAADRVLFERFLGAAGCDPRVASVDLARLLKHKEERISVLEEELRVSKDKDTLQQAARAQDWAEERSRLEQKIRGLEESNQDKDREIHQLNSAEHQLIKERDEMLNRFHQKLTEKDNLIKVERQHNVDVEEELSAVKERLSCLEERGSAGVEELTGVKRQLAARNEELDDLACVVARKEEEIAANAAELKQKDVVITAMDFVEEQSCAEIAQLSRDKEEGAAAVLRLQTLIQEKDQLLAGKDAELGRLEGDLGRSQATVERLEGEMGRLRLDLEEKRTAAAAMAGWRESLEDEILANQARLIALVNRDE